MRARAWHDGMKSLLLIAAGSACGGVLRHLLGCRVRLMWVGGSFPWHTLLINLSGCLVLGFLTGLAERCPGLPQEWRLALTVGLCGGFTTFSTFAQENIELLRSGSLFLPAAYTALSLIGGLALAALGFCLAR